MNEKYAELLVSTENQSIYWNSLDHKNTISKNKCAGEKKRYASIQ